MAVASGAYKKALEGDQTPKQVLVKIDRVTKKFDETMAWTSLTCRHTSGRST
jgi:putrescine transport system ATP-binding protein